MIVGDSDWPCIANIVDDLANYNVLYGSAYVITGIYDWVKKAFIAWNIVEKEDIWGRSINTTVNSFLL